MYLAMTRRTGEAVKGIPAAEFGDDDRLDKIIQKLFSLFLEDKSATHFIWQSL